jgi:ribonuclease BN (tRNA processing enzyme)
LEPGLRSSIPTVPALIVISGDTRPSPELVKACRRCDILIHEVYPRGSRATMPDWPQYRVRCHTSTQELGEIASQSQSGLLIVYHRTGGLTNFSDEQYLKEIGQGYSGRVVIGHDLEVY